MPCYRVSHSSQGFGREENVQCKGLSFHSLRGGLMLLFNAQIPFSLPKCPPPGALKLHTQPPPPSFTPQSVPHAHVYIFTHTRTHSDPLKTRNLFFTCQFNCSLSGAEQRITSLANDVCCCYTLINILHVIILCLLQQQIKR